MCNCYFYICISYFYNSFFVYDPSYFVNKIADCLLVFGKDGAKYYPYTFEEYDAALSAATTSPVFSVLRFSDGGYELFDMTYDLSAAGQIAVLSLCDTTPLF